MNRSSLKSESVDSDRSKFLWVREIHIWLGRILLAVSFFQVYLGLNIMYPWERRKISGMISWALYLFFVVFWTLAFLVTEIYYQKRIVPGMIVQNSPALERNSQLGIALLLQKDKKLTTFSWADINDARAKGYHTILTRIYYVVVEGNYVFEITNWIGTHPGGKMILQSVVGTDITHDYFNASGRDISQFIPKGLQTKGGVNKTGKGLTEKYTGHGTMILEQSLVSNSEWKHVLRARKTRVHSTSALQRLSKFLVGQLVFPKSEPLDEPGIRFDPQEYRRYAIVSVKRENNGPVYRVKFCSLYPDDTRVGAPKRFCPGNSVKIMYFKNGQYHSRHYTPINGNLNCFEVIIKTYPNGVVSKFLANEKPGDRQFQIAGPFGDLILNKGISQKYDDLVYITGGSGLVAALALINAVLLPVGVPIRVNKDYQPIHSDELAVKTGDWITIERQNYDGWALVVDMATKKEGVIPLAVTDALNPMKLTILNTCKTETEIFGREIIAGAILAHPNQIAVQHALSQQHRTSSARDAEYGKILVQSLDEKVIVNLIHSSRGSRTGNQKIVICGPVELERMVCHVLKNVLNIDSNQIIVLPNAQG